MLNIIVAPEESCHSAIGIAKSIVKFLKTEKIEYSVYFSREMEDVAKNAMEILSFGETDFVVVGDDSTLFNFINAFKDISKIKLGIIPAGKQDDFASYLNLESNPIQAIKNILNKKIEQIDLLRVNDKRVLNNVIIGATVEATEKFQQYKLKNAVTEKFANLRYANNFAGIKLELEGKGIKEKEVDVYELVVANGGLSKGKQVSPLSNVIDGIFNLNYSTCETKDAKNKYAKLFNAGKHIYDENTKQYWLETLAITSPDNQIKVMIDGQISTVEKLDIEILAGCLKIYK